LLEYGKQKILSPAFVKTTVGKPKPASHQERTSRKTLQLLEISQSTNRFALCDISKNRVPFNGTAA